MTARTLTASRTLLGTTLPFAIPIGLSAFLLFSVEPLVGRLVLPVFGGTPAVWATALFFFQAVLLAGYLYGHVSITRLGQWGPPVHLALAGLGVRRPGRRAGARRRPADRDAAAGAGPAADPVRPGRPAGLRPDDDHAARLRLVRGRAVRARRRSLLALRPEQRRVAARAAGLSPGHRAASRPGRPARDLDRRLRRAGRPAGPRGHPGHAGDRRASPGGRSARRHPGHGHGDFHDGHRHSSHRRPRHRLAAPPPLAAPGGDPVGAPVRGHQLHRHGPRLGAAPVGRAAGDLPGVVHRRVLAPRRAPRAARRPRRARDGHAAVGAVRVRRRAGRSWPSWSSSSSRSGSSPSPSTAASPRTGRTRRHLTEFYLICPPAARWRRRSSP